MVRGLISCRRAAAVALLSLAGLAAAACDSVPLLAPTKSTITVSAPVKFLPTNGTVEITASVVEEAGTTVQNGTAVRFSTSLGSLEPVQALTRNGFAVTTFHANNTSGVARITASSGNATGGEGSTNVVEITIGAAGVNTVTIRANPGNVGPNGGIVELIATVVGENGQGLSGIGVTFNTDQGILSGANAVTNSVGEARTNLTTSQQAVVSATAGTKTSSTVTIAVRSGPIVTLACAPASGTGNCAAVQASTSNNTATVLFTVTRASGSSALRSATLDFGDGTSQELGNLAGGTLTSTHVYEGPSGSTARSYTATLRATDINGESAATSTAVSITPRAQLTVTLSATLGTAVATVGQPVTLTATVTPTDGVSKYEWTFAEGDTAETSGNVVTHVYTTRGAQTATVKVTTTDGRTATGRAEFITSGF